MIPSAAKATEEINALNGVPAPEIRAQLDLVLRSRVFVQSHRIRRFLEFVVRESLLGQTHRLKEYLIGLEVFDRREAFDPRVDSIVRVEARRLRYKLEEYYRGEGREDPVCIVLRKGCYVPVFEYRSSGPSPSASSNRSAIEFVPFSLINPPADAAVVVEEIQRRLTHVLVREGCFQVLAKPHAGEEPGQGANTIPATKPDYIIEGSLEFKPDRFRFILQLLRCAGHSYIWSGATDGRMGDLGLVEQLAQTLLRDLMASAGDTARRQVTRKESRDFYLQGRYYWKLATPDSISESAECFSKAVECDNNYAAAWAALTEALLVSSAFGFEAPAGARSRMKEAAQKAIDLDPSLPEAYVALGSVQSILEWDWAAGEQQLERAIQLDKHDPVGHIAYGIHLACRGKLDAAVAEVERALELDPAALFPNFILGWLYGVCRRYDDAIAQHNLVARLSPDYGLSQFGLGLAYAGKGLFTDAIAHFTNASHMKCRSLLHGQIAYCYARAGRMEDALREVSTLSIRSESNPVSPVSFAIVYAGLGDAAKAIDCLEQAVEVHDTSLPAQLLSCEFDPLRNEPRFLELRAKIGLA